MSGQTRKVIKRSVPSDLIAAIFKAEGWQFNEGESRVARVKQYYELTADPRANRYIATPKASCCSQVSA